MAQPSISWSLRSSLMIVGTVGLVVLLGAIVLDYHITFVALEQPRALSRALHEVAAHVVLPALVIVLPMGIASYFVVRSALHPIDLAAQAVEQTRSSAPGWRIDSSDFPAEIAPLADGVNGLLARLEDSSERNAAFAADVAHELRTPLTVLGLELEQLKDVDTTHLEDQVRRMQKLVNQLMLIARLELQEQQPGLAQPVDLQDMASNVVAQMAPRALAAGRTLAMEDLGAIPVTGHAEALAAALRNLIDNALRVTPRGGTVTVLVGPGTGMAVADGGAGLSNEQLEALSDRHARSDNASDDGAGLGLAIVRKIVTAHGGTLSTDPELSRLSMTFPAAHTVRSPSVKEPSV